MFAVHGDVTVGQSVEAVASAREGENPLVYDAQGQEAAAPYQPRKRCGAAASTVADGGNLNTVVLRTGASANASANAAVGSGAAGGAGPVICSGRAAADLPPQCIHTPGGGRAGKGRGRLHESEAGGRGQERAERREGALAGATLLIRMGGVQIV